MIRAVSRQARGLVFGAVAILTAGCEESEVDRVESAAREAAEVVERQGREILTAARKHARRLCQRLEEALRATAIDPKRDASSEEVALDLAIKLVPFVGPVKRYANARALYKEAKRTRDEARASEAKRQCLLAATEEGLDIATLGTSALSRVADVADLSVAVVRVSSTVSSVTGIEELNAFAPLADKALESAIVDRAVVMLLTVPIGELVPAVEESNSG